MRSNFKYFIFIMQLIISVSCSSSGSSGGGGDDDGPIVVDPPIVDVVTLPIDFDPDYQLLSSESYLLDKLFYFFSVLSDSNIKDELNALIDNQSQRLNDKLDLLNQASTNNPASANLYTSYFEFSESEIEEIALWLESKVSEYANFNAIVTDHFRPSGHFELYNELSNDRFVYFAWKDAALGINNILGEYLEGDPPQDLVSDGPFYSVSSTTYRDLINDLIDFQNSISGSYTWFFEPAMIAALSILELNGRDEAGRYEPLENGKNMLAINSMQNVNWSNYTYSGLVVLGDSPNSSGDAQNISNATIDRIQTAVNLYDQGLTPFLILSGANLYPNHTSYHEAIEMKKHILNNHASVPESAIIVEPHSRHATSNMRDASRLIFKYKFPTDKKFIVTTSPGHSEYLEGNSFTSKSIEIFGYVPVEFGNRIADHTIEFIPLANSLQMDSEADPLDP